MQADLQPPAPMSQVVFVHEYLQLVFDDTVFTFLSLTTYSTDSTELRQGEAGFCDALVSLIGQTAQAEALSDALLLHFSGGAIVSVSTSGSETRGPEGWHFGPLGGPYVVEQSG